MASLEGWSSTTKLHPHVNAYNYTENAPRCQVYAAQIIVQIIVRTSMRILCACAVLLAFAHVICYNITIMAIKNAAGTADFTKVTYKKVDA